MHANGTSFWPLRWTVGLSSSIECATSIKCSLHSVSRCQSDGRKVSPRTILLWMRQPTQSRVCSHYYYLGADRSRLKWRVQSLELKVRSCERLCAEHFGAVQSKSERLKRERKLLRASKRTYLRRAKKKKKKKRCSTCQSKGCHIFARKSGEASMEWKPKLTSTFSRTVSALSRPKQVRR